MNDKKNMLEEALDDLDQAEDAQFEESPTDENVTTQAESVDATGHEGETVEHDDVIKKSSSWKQKGGKVFALIGFAALVTFVWFDKTGKGQYTASQTSTPEPSPISTPAVTATVDNDIADMSTSKISSATSDDSDFVDLDFTGESPGAALEYDTPEITPVNIDSNVPTNTLSSDFGGLDKPTPTFLPTTGTTLESVDDTSQAEVIFSLEDEIQEPSANLKPSIEQIESAISDSTSHLEARLYEISNTLEKLDRKLNQSNGAELKLVSGPALCVQSVSQRDEACPDCKSFASIKYGGVQRAIGDGETIFDRFIVKIKVNEVQLLDSQNNAAFSYFEANPGSNCS